MILELLNEIDALDPEDEELPQRAHAAMDADEDEACKLEEEKRRKDRTKR